MNIKVEHGCSNFYWMDTYAFQNPRFWCVCQDGRCIRELDHDWIAFGTLHSRNRIHTCWTLCLYSDWFFPDVHIYVALKKVHSRMFCCMNRRRVCFLHECFHDSLCVVSYRNRDHNICKSAPFHLMRLDLSKYGNRMAIGWLASTFWMICLIWCSIVL